MKFESHITETIIVLDDGTEVLADVVLKDEDLDFAFIKPKEPSDKFVYVPLKARERPIELLDEFFVIGRLGKSENRAIHLNTRNDPIDCERTPHFVCMRSGSFREQFRESGIWC